MRTLLLAALASGCASIPIPDGPSGPDVSSTGEVEVCVVWGERTDRRRYEGVAELSLERWNQAIVTIVVRHPTAGLVVIDPAFGVEIEDDLRRVPPWFRIISGGAKQKQPAVIGLEQAGIDPRQVRTALITHAHWDHTGGLRDLPKADVLMSKAEYDLVQSSQKYLSHGVMKHHFDKVAPRVKTFELDGPPVLRFEASKDLFADGSVVALSLPGHTPGSTAYLLRGTGGKRWLLIGDTTWTLRGVEKPAHKMVPGVDQDRAGVSVSIGRVHAVSREHPEITVVPAHDGEALETIPTCAAPAAAAR